MVSMLHTSDEDAGWKFDLTASMSFWYYIVVSVNYSLMCGMAEEQKEHGAQITLQVPHPYDSELFL